MEFIDVPLLARKEITALKGSLEAMRLEILSLSSVLTLEEYPGCQRPEEGWGGRERAEEASGHTSRQPHFNE